jgi:hypothetical protein
MKHLLLFIVIFLTWSGTVLSQDLIVTDKGDSLNCKITKIKNDFIYFTFRFENEIRNTLLPVRQIKFYKKDFFSIPDVPPDKVKNVDGNYQKLRIGGYGGWSYMTGKISSNVHPFLREYLKDLKSGYHFGGDFVGFISENIGFGAKYSRFRTTNELIIYVYDPITGQGNIGKLRDDITIQFFAPTFTSRFSSANKKINFLSDISIGYLTYKNKATEIYNFTLKGRTVGGLLDLGVDFSVAKNLSLGLCFSYTLGILNQIEYDDGIYVMKIKLDENNLENISRIDLSVGLRWNK